MRALNILIVDDDQDLAECLGMALENRGHTVRLTFSGEEGLASFRQQPADLTFMDVRLPRMNGVECFLALRKLSPGAQVMLITGHSDKNLLQQALAQGALGVLKKPFSIQAMLDVVARVASVKQG